MNVKQSQFGIRTSLENFAQYDKIKVFPLYAIGNWGKPKYFDFFLNIQKNIIFAPKKWQKTPNLDWEILQIDVIFGSKY